MTFQPLALLLAIWIFNAFSADAQDRSSPADLAKLREEIAQIRKEHEKLAKGAPEQPVIPLYQKLLWIALPVVLSAAFSGYFSHRFTIRRDKQVLARETVAQLREMRGEIAVVMGILLADEHEMTELHRNRVTAVGDYMDTAAQRFLKGNLDRTVFDQEINFTPEEKDVITELYGSISSSNRFAAEIRRWKHFKQYHDERTS